MSVCDADRVYAAPSHHAIIREVHFGEGESNPTLQAQAHVTTRGLLSRAGEPRPQLSRRSEVRSIDYTWLLAFCWSALCTLAFVALRGLDAHWSLSTQFTFYCSLALSGTGLVYSAGRGATAFLGIFYFMFVFYGIAVVVQVANRWDPIFYDDELVRTAFAIALLFLVIVSAMMLSEGGGQAAKDRRSDPVLYKLRRSRSLFRILLACALVDGVLLAYFGPHVFTYIEVFSQEVVDRVGDQFYLVLRNFAFPLLVVLPTLCVLAAWHARRIGLALFAVVVLCLGVTFNNPLITPRFLLAALLMGSVSVAIGPRRTGVLLGMMLIGNYVFPFFHAFRAEHFVRGDSGLVAFLSYDYDSASVLVYGVLYVLERGYTYGANLLSAILFFVPDELWTGKLETTGVYVREWMIMEYRFSPLRTATPLFLEGYVAFGWAGVGLVGIMFGAAARRLDRTPVSHSLEQRICSIPTVLLSYSPMLLVILCRGTLMSAFAYTCGVGSAVAVAVLVVRMSAPPEVGASQRRTAMWDRENQGSTLTDRSPSQSRNLSRLLPGKRW